MPRRISEARGAAIRRPDDRTFKQEIERCPEVASRFREVHAMFCHLGQCLAHGFGGQEPRGAAQFNVACDPLSSNFILSGAGPPDLFDATEVTRVKEIGFFNVQ